MSQDITEKVKLNMNELVFRAEGDTGDFITLHEDKCNGCGDCVLICAVSLWSVPKGKKAKLSSRYRELCVECAGCWQMCDQDAIEFSYPKGGTGVTIMYG